MTQTPPDATQPLGAQPLDAQPLDAPQPWVEPRTRSTWTRLRAVLAGGAVAALVAVGLGGFAVGRATADDGGQPGLEQQGPFGGGGPGRQFPGGQGPGAQLPGGQGLGGQAPGGQLPGAPAQGGGSTGSQT